MKQISDLAESSSQPDIATPPRRGFRFYRSPEQIAASRINKAAWSKFFALLPCIAVDGYVVWFTIAERRAKSFCWPADDLLFDDVQEYEYRRIPPRGAY